MRTVFSNDEVPKLWASQSQYSGGNARRTLWFEGPRIYSYSACIGHLAKDVDDNTIAVLSSCTWSVTTSRHQHRVRMAVHGRPQFIVPSVDHLRHDRNIEYLMSLAHVVAEREASSRHDRTFLHDRLTQGMSSQQRAQAIEDRMCVVRMHVQTARRYALTFGQPLPDFDSVSLMTRINEMFDRFLDPKAARRERAKVCRERAKAKRTERAPTITPIQPPRGWIA
ncbi:hypothetical protein UFOVP706_29 [uncultured Caudovirales phage]|uniref:Uncharacterized protein n=1 Tax=uncultured Caudovirales phage TaxID=2100421 RepID=A0A6J5NU99_9CAUD|nr:hypothetical protein UFOVP706_29 [uncultured Caudovirales phage]